MVLTQRRAYEAVRRSSSLSLASGEAMPQSPASSTTSRRSSYEQYMRDANKTFQSQWKIMNFLSKIAFVVIAASWVFAMGAISKQKSTLRELSFEHQALLEDNEESMKMLADAQNSFTAVKKLIDRGKKKTDILKHEVRANEEMKDVSGFQKRKEARKGKEQQDILVEVVKERHDGLQKKAIALQKYIQDESKKAVIKEYGSGPHQVKFTVVFNGDKEFQQVVIELASLEEMPHSVYAFLGSVKSRLWDNCVFKHIEKINHVLMASPVSFYDGDSRETHFSVRQLEKGPSFPEYSESYPHEKYSVGFSNLGPAFYFNMKNNTKSHGPGGQGHHDLPNDAEPCFGNVVKGHEVVDKMFKIIYKRPKEGEKHIWSNKGMTRIVKAEIL